MTTDTLRNNLYTAHYHTKNFLNDVLTLSYFKNFDFSLFEKTYVGFLQFSVTNLSIGVYYDNNSKTLGFYIPFLTLSIWNKDEDPISEAILNIVERLNTGLKVSKKNKGTAIEEDFNYPETYKDKPLISNKPASEETLSKRAQEKGVPLKKVIAKLRKKHEVSKNNYVKEEGTGELKGKKLLTLEKNNHQQWVPLRLINEGKPRKVIGAPSKLHQAELPLGNTKSKKKFKK